MRRLCSVALSAWSQAARTLSETALRSPTMRMRTPSLASLVRYLDTATSTSPMRPDTSSVGRFQFSEEKANTVRYSMPRSAQACTVRTSASTPCLWPKKRGSRRRLAQRPLPSITIATWRGTLWCAGGLMMDKLRCQAENNQAAAAEPASPGRWRRPLGGGAEGASGGAHSHRQDLRFLAVNQLVDLGDRAV